MCHRIKDSVRRPQASALRLCTLTRMTPFQKTVRLTAGCRCSSPLHALLAPLSFIVLHNLVNPLIHATQTAYRQCALDSQLSMP